MTLLTHFLLERIGLKHSVACDSSHTLVIPLKTKHALFVSASFVLCEYKFLILLPSSPNHSCWISNLFSLCFLWKSKNEMAFFSFYLSHLWFRLRFGLGTQLSDRVLAGFSPQYRINEFKIFFKNWDFCTASSHGVHTLILPTWNVSEKLGNWQQMRSMYSLGEQSLPANWPWASFCFGYMLCA